MSLNIINDNLVTANSRARFYNTSPATADGNSRILFDTTDFNVGGGFTLDTVNREIVCNFNGYVKVNADLATTAGSLTTCRISLNNGVEYAIGVANAIGNRSASSAMIPVQNGDRISVKDGNGATYGGASWDMNLDIYRLADYSAGQPAGFALASASDYGLVKSEVITVDNGADLVQASPVNLQWYDVPGVEVTLQPGRWAVTIQGFMNIVFGAGGGPGVAAQAGLRQGSTVISTVQCTAGYSGVAGGNGYGVGSVTEIITVSTPTTYKVSARAATIGGGNTASAFTFFDDEADYGNRHSIVAMRV